VIDVGGEAWIRIRVIEWFLDEDLVDSIGSRLHPAGPREILGEGLADEVPERHAPGAGGLGRPAMQVPGQQELRTVHV